VKGPTQYQSSQTLDVSRLGSLGQLTRRSPERSHYVGFAGVAIAIAVHGTDLVFPTGSVPLVGPVSMIAAEADIAPGPPEGVFDIVDPPAPDAVLDLDAAAVEWIYRSHYADGYALKQVLPEQHPVLWPEQFDLAATEDEVNYGVSAGDDYHALPYAYVGPWTPHTGSFWNAPFGAVRALDPGHDVDELSADIVAFLTEGRTRLSEG
jgi:hypothetical protein